MYQFWLKICLASIAALGAGTALAQPTTGCPAGHAVQSFDMSGRSVACIPVPDAAALLGAVSDEKAARIAADDELRASIAADTSVVGSYTFTGTQACLSSSLGFNPDLTPVQAPFTPIPPAPDPNLPPPPPIQVVSAIVSPSFASTSGTRTFNANGTGTAEFHTQTVNPPGFFYNSFGAGVTSGGPNFKPGGGGSMSVITGTFTWRIEGNRLIIDDHEGSSGTIIRGGTRVGWTVSSEGVPRAVGILGKDLRIFSIVQEELKVEVGILRSPDGLTEFRTPRICHRERTMRKL